MPGFAVITGVMDREQKGRSHSAKMETKQGNKDTQKSRHSYGGRRRERGAEAPWRLRPMESTW
jgi:hypothetical protein